MAKFFIGENIARLEVTWIWQVLCCDTLKLQQFFGSLLEGRHDEASAKVR